MRPKKLLSNKMLSILKEQTDIGVPLSAVIRKLDLDLSQPAVAKLLKQYNCALNKDNAEVIFASLFPLWVTTDSHVHEQPECWYYEGYFPYGEWMLR